MSATTNETLVEELNDLIEIQNDRIKGYENAIEDLREKNTDLRAVFQKKIDTSRRHKDELIRQVALLGGETAEGTTVTGKIYRFWMDIKSAITAHDREDILESCKYGESAAQKAYDMALNSDAEMSAEIRQMINSQQIELKAEQEEISRLEYAADQQD